MIGLFGAGALYSCCSVDCEPLLASLQLPEIPLIGGRFAVSAADRTGLFYHHDSGVISVCCQYQIAPERAVAWAHKLLETVKADQVVVLGTFSELSLSEEDPEQVFALATDAMRKRGALPVPFLPPPNIVSGAVAGVLQFCQVHQIAAVALLTRHLHGAETSALAAARFSGAMRSLIPQLPVPPVEKMQKWDAMMPHEDKYRNLYS